MEKVAIITGITGQDGSYLAELLLSKGYVVYGIVRRSSLINTHRIDHVKDRIKLVYGDVTDSTCMMKIIKTVADTHPLVTFEVYNLAAQSHVKVSFDIPEYTINVDAFGTLIILEAIRNLGLIDRVRFYQASTSELYGLVQQTPQDENTAFYPRSPYGVAKLYGFWIVKNYREAYGMYACNGILFNHESPRRGETFVTRKITLGLRDILNGTKAQLVLGNINSLRDWGHARDYVEGMWRILQLDKPDDFVLATGEQHSIREFVEKVFKLRGFDIAWKGEGVNEIGYDWTTGRELVVVSDRYFRPTEVETLLGNPAKAKQILGWESKTSFDELVREMVDGDCPLPK